MASLRSEHKRLIVTRLATFVTSTEIIEELKEMGVEASYTQISYYDPTLAGSNLAQQWKDLHAAARKAFIEDASSVAASHRTWRVRELQDMARLAKKAKNYKLAAELLEQAAKEMGDSYTNRRTIQALPGQPALPGGGAELPAGAPGTSTIGIYLPDNGRRPANEAIIETMVDEGELDDIEEADLVDDDEEGEDTEEEVTALPHKPVDGADPWAGY